ncbi:helix-turn-helix domain-containing protein [Paenibacillus profundus]|uniref:Helix-turn-helix domain-containing protein n=1 Tax=Paenibacillus profundus TaxID=1173085 RepID=A0ABS8YQD1_9BACL|nr:helix-turn-helix transcriptional regulator [Paenibacillus profundus]MCE5173149.1 helix-turn-helix domain-containing protein [Paenibacillus profundus]
MSSVSTVVSTLGELIQRYRNEQAMTQTQLADLAGINKGSISKIENGDFKRPDYRTIQPLIAALQIPLHEVIEHYALTDPRSETMFELLQQSVPYQDSSLTVRIASHFLACQDEVSDILLQKLFHFTQQLTGPTELQLALFEIVISYARSHGMQLHVAEGMLHKYLVERNDFSKLEETFQSGKYVLQYIEFLSSEEQVTLYYKLGVHAYNLRRFSECIELCKKAVIEDRTESSFKAYSTLLICSSYFHQKQYELAEKYLKTFSLFSFPFVKENVELMTAKLHEKKGDIELAIAQLQQCLESSSDKINIVNALLTLYLSKRDLQSAHQLFDREQDLITAERLNPTLGAEHAHYLMNKGKYLKIVDKYNEAIDCFIQSATIFANICEQKYTYECLELIFQLSKSMDDSTVEMKVKKLFAELKNEEVVV